MKKINHGDRIELETIANSISLIDVGVYTDGDDLCYLATISEYDNTNALTPTDLCEMVYSSDKHLPKWATHVLWISK